MASLKESPTRDELLRTLERLAPLSLAGSWDNVGLLVESSADREAPVHAVLLTIDLNETVFQEAIELDVELIVAYHPPIFGGLKRLRRGQGGERRLLDAIAAGIDIYSPHTALDAVRGGVCDWLGECLGPLSLAKPIEANAARPEEGAGRLVSLKEAASLSTILDRIHDYLAPPYLRVAAPASLRDGEVLIQEVALCPGAGGSLFEGLKGPQLYLTGELRHHDILALVDQGAAVVLTEHSRCERGYLPRFAEQLRAEWSTLSVYVSQRDDDPLQLSLRREA